MSDVTIGTTGSEAVVINNATDGLQTTTSYALRLSSDSNHDDHGAGSVV